MCIFCKIINKEIPSSVVYEDDDVLAILDISQTTKGHTLVMPKKHYDNILAMSPEEAGLLMAKARIVAEKVVKGMNANGFNLLVNTNEAAGQTVMHTHMHIIPRYDEEDTVSISFSENKEDLGKILEMINSKKA